MTPIKTFLPFMRQFLLSLVALLLFTSAAQAEKKETPTAAKRVIGPIVAVEESESDFTFPARVDTGATTSSLHVESWEVEDEASDMSENIGKHIRFQLKNEEGQSEWLRRKIVEISVIKTSEQAEMRYKVPIKLHCKDVKKQVLVSLNDRSHMTYPLLLGRNFLQDDFVVDVALGKNQGGQLVHVKPQAATAKQRKQAEPEKQATASAAKKLAKK